jgi:hypothetical protein
VYAGLVAAAAAAVGLVGTYVPRRVEVAPHGGFSHTIYLNDCRPDGCVVIPGNDDSRANRSTIPTQTSQLPPWPYGDDEWNQLVACVRETYAPFDVQIVTTDPGQANHFEVFVAGRPEDIQFSDALGVAPFISCNGIPDNVPSFVFADVSNSTDQLCWAVAQESAHVFGLDHVLLAADPMTYLAPPFRKRFQDEDGNCGEEIARPRECWCGGSTQNSYQFLLENFGESDLPPPGVSITTPHSRAWVQPGFVVGMAIDSLVAMREVSLAVDDVTTTTLRMPPFGFNAPAELVPGFHTVRIRAIDQRNLQGEDEIVVRVLASCGAGCADGTLCLGGVCVPDATNPGGLGTACALPEDCGSGTCTSTLDDGARCTATCDPGRACPAGFSCIGAGDGLCWPAADSGGCNAGGGGGGGGGWALAVLSILLSAVIMRRQGRPHGQRSTSFDA